MAVRTADSGIEKRGLTLYVAVESSLGHTESTRDIVHLRSSIALRDEDVGRCIEQLPNTLGRYESWQGL